MITIVGAGAIGGVLGAYLSRAGHPVTLVDREAAHMAAINAHGLRITGCRGELVQPVRAITPAELGAEPALGFVILAVKAMHTEAALEPVIPRLGPGGFVVSLQNGFNEEVIAARIGVARTVGCFVHFGADYQEPGHILLAYDYPLYISEWSGEASARIREIKAVLDDAMPTVITDNLWGYFWGKMGYAALAYAVALTDQPTHAVLAVRELRPFLRAVVREAAAVAAAEGRHIEKVGDMDAGLFLDASPAGIARIDAAWDAQIAAARERSGLKVFTGIQRDLMVRKRKTEVDAHMGALMAHAARVGVPTPRIAATVAMIHEIEDGRRHLGLANLRELAAALP